MKKLIFKSVSILVLLLFFGSQKISAQVTNVDMAPGVNGTTFFTCGAALHDSGGQPGTGYQNNENVTITICPDVPGDAITINFITFNLSNTGPNADNLTIYDGNTTGAATLGTYGGTALQGLLVTCTSLNTSGCLTLVFHSNNAGLGVFAGSITCTTPCQRPTAVLAAPTDTTILICSGETLTFDGSPSYAAAGFNIQQYLWDFDDGTLDSTSGPVVSHTFTGIGEFRVDLYLFDDNGCASTNRVTVQLLSGTTPTFVGTTPDTSICLGEFVCLDGVVNPVTYTGLPHNNLGGATYLPDQVGSCFTSTIDFNIFQPGQTLTNINDLIDICVTMEHSYIGDLVASIYCPNGTQVILYQQGGGWNSLGEPIDISGPADPPGVGYTYCWADNAPLGTWTQCGNAGATPNLITLPSGIETLAPGTYSSLNPLSGLVGCPLNGVWELEFCDLWGADDGWVFDWSINFNSALYPDIVSFTPVYGDQCDSTFWTPVNGASAAIISSTSADCNQICVTPTAVGSYSYKYTAIDDFGCQYDTTITVTVTPPPTVDAGPDLVACPNVPIQLQATVPNTGAPCNFTIQMHDSFGDGWNNAQLTVTINGVPQIVTMLNGSNQNTVVVVPAGATYSFDYLGGWFENEVSYEIVDCNGNTVFQDGPFPATGVVFSGMNGLDIIYSWTPTTGLSDPTIANPTATVNAPITYYVNIYENGHPMCFQTDSVNITINPAVFAGVDAIDTVCYTEPIFDLFPMLGTGVSANGSWFDNAFAAASNMFDPLVTPSGDYYYIVPANAGCPADTAVVNIFVRPVGDPLCCQVSFTTNLTNISCNTVCDGVIEMVSTNAVQYSYDGGLTFVSNASDSNLCVGTYDVFAMGLGGCLDSATVSLVVLNSVRADFMATPQPTTIFYPNINFTNLSSGTSVYSWDFAGLGTSNLQDPEFIFPEDSAGVYNVCLIASNPAGCVDTICKDVVISDEFVLYAPNAFIPDGNGLNDIFYVVGNDIDPNAFELFLFDRWGEQIFYSKSLSSGWDGTHKGQKCVNDVYVWKVKTRSLLTGKYYEFYGHVALIR